MQFYLLFCETDMSLSTHNAMTMGACVFASPNCLTHVTQPHASNTTARTLWLSLNDMLPSGLHASRGASASLHSNPAQTQMRTVAGISTYLRNRSKTESLCPLSVLDTDRSKPEVCCSSPALPAESFLSVVGAFLASSVGSSRLVPDVCLSGGL